MTTPSEPADDGQDPPKENPQSPDLPIIPNQPAGAGPADLNPAEAESSAQTTNPEEGLPEWEPLTPELVEDEAIRGDFVIRWAIVGLALLFGFAAITDTRTLVHIRTGEYMASHGILPPAKDVFSYTAGDRKWVNLAWLFDLTTAGIYSAAGGIGLSIAQGLLAGLAFGFVAHAYRPGIRTWWGSICAALALLACYPQFTAQPELMTLVGMSLLLWVLIHAEEACCSRTLWMSVGVIWLWSQFDGRAFLGWLLLICLAIGQSFRRDENAKLRRSLWWKVALASVAVTAIHPFLWESWLAPFRLYAIDYPALRRVFPSPGIVEIGFHPITFKPFWFRINHDSIAALVLFVATIVVFVLNRERLKLGYLVAFIVFSSLACLTTHELAVVSLVNCVLCTINAQEWYRNRFGQVYSVDWRELLFSRGGRAVTVFCFFALAWLVISGRIDGPSGRRTAVGFDEGLLVQMDSYRQVAEHSLDDRPFHFTPRQGDLIIWSGQKSFIDMRAGLFSGSGDHDLIGLHGRTCAAIRTKKDGRDDPEVWQKTFETYQLSHAMPRLTGPVPPPDFITFGDLLVSSNWALTELNASTAVFYRTDPKFTDYLRDHRLDFATRAFRTIDETATKKALVEVRIPAKAATLADSMFSVRKPRYPAGVQLAGHYFQLAQLHYQKKSLPASAACALLAIRYASAGLREDSNCADGYQMLGQTYLLLDHLETKVMEAAGIRWFSQVRYYQAVAALQQAALLRPDDILLQKELRNLFARTGRGELALGALRNMKRILQTNADSARIAGEDLSDIEAAAVELEERLAQIEAHADQQLQNGADRFQVAAFAYQTGAVHLAIRTVEDDPIYKQKNQIARNSLGAWLIEVGRIQEGLDTLEQASGEGGMPGWQDSLATSMLINGDYARAIDLWKEQITETNSNVGQAVIQTMPFLTLNSTWMTADQYPFTHAAAAAEVLGRVRNENAALTYQIAQAQLELGDVAAASQSLQFVFDKAPNMPLQTLVKFYLGALRGEKVADPSVEPPVLEEFLPLDEEPAKKDPQPAADKASPASTKTEDKN